MTVRLRLQRLGKPHRPYYRVVAIDQRAKRDGKPIEILGQYDTVPTEKVVTINKERAQYWLKQGAQPSQTVASVFKKAGITI
ncbi:MAG: 30S ribosomal protein S16 [Endomicrobiales bacterium]